MVDRRDGDGRFGGSWASRLAAAAALLLLVGCGPYEPEPEFPQHVEYVAPAPPSAEQLAAEQRAQEQAHAETREILIGAEEGEYADTDPSALTEFKPVLDPHGTWVEDPTFGTVWVPNREEVGEDFQPYVTAGRWTYSEETSYVWVSDYSWGWVPFHYGRWVYLPARGWAWIPGRRYAGAWVTWRVGPAGYGYVGWAPAPPEWYWYNGTAVAWSFTWYRPYDYYVYCPHHRVYSGPVATYVVRGTAARQHDARTRDYVPAAPAVGSRVLAAPSVGGPKRVVATPSVGGTNRVAAAPTVGAASSSARARMTRGPRPDELGVSKDIVVAPPASHPGLSRAHAFASPSTAAAVGAAPPAHLQLRPSVQPARPVAPSIAGQAPAARAGAAQPFPSSPSVSTPSVRPTPLVQPSTPSVRPTPLVRPSTPSVRPTPLVRPSTPSAPTFRPSAPAVRSTPTPRPSSPSVSSPSFRSSPSPRATPSFRSSSPSVRSSSPSVRSSSRASSAPSRSARPAVRSNSFRRR